MLTIENTIEKGKAFNRHSPTIAVAKEIDEDVNLLIVITSCVEVLKSGTIMYMNRP